MTSTTTSLPHMTSARFASILLSLIVFLFPILAPLAIFDLGTDPAVLATRIYYLITIILFVFGHRLILSAFEKMFLQTNSSNASTRFGYLNVAAAIFGALLFIMTIVALRNGPSAQLFWLLIIYITIKPIEIRLARTKKPLLALTVSLLSNCMITLAVLRIMDFNWLVPGAIFGIAVASLVKALELVSEIDSDLTILFNQRLALAISILLFPALIGLLAITNLLHIAYLGILLALPVSSNAIQKLQLAERGGVVINKIIIQLAVLKSTVTNIYLVILIGAILIFI